ncbi:MAG: class I SAM-dependent methyltransferase [Chloroflexota bacterium]
MPPRESNTTEPASSTFDEFASDYDVALNQGLTVTGEDKSFFAEQRIVHLAHCLEVLGFEAREALDMGCGTGTATPYFFKHLHVEQMYSVDTSEKCLEVAAATWKEYAVRFFEISAYQPAGKIDLAFCNGVFHHIPPDKRSESLERILEALRPGGLFAFWENNPWNPGTRYVMSRLPFDRDAALISAPKARHMLRKAGFQILRTDFLFIFPRLLRWLRGLEAPLMKLPLGGQYQVLCRKLR